MNGRPWCFTMVPEGDWLNGRTDSTFALGLILLNVFGACMSQQVLQRLEIAERDL